MEKERNMKYLNDRRIIYRRLPITDVPSETYEWGSYYEFGTYQCYELFRTEYKINSHKSLKWHLIILRYLNSELDIGTFRSVSRFISDKDNGFTIFNINNMDLDNILSEVMDYDYNMPPKNRLRKVIFKPFCGLTKEQKLSLVGRLMGRHSIVDDETVYQCMLEINHEGIKISTKNLSDKLKCSSRTLFRNMSELMKAEKKLLNNGLKQKK